MVFSMAESSFMQLKEYKRFLPNECNESVEQTDLFMISFRIRPNKL